jgi:AcrR family transcriptional regulator
VSGIGAVVEVPGRETFDSRRSSFDVRSLDVDVERVEKLIDDWLCDTEAEDAADRRTRKRQHTKAAILRSAWRLFLTVGYDGTTVNDITEAADIGKGTFFAYFARKSDAVLALCHHRRNVAISRYRHGGLKGRSARESIIGLIEELAKLNGQTSPEARIMAEMSLRQFLADTEIMRDETPPMEVALIELIDAGIASGEFDSSTNAEAVARLVHAAYYSTKAAWLRTGPLVVPFDLVERVRLDVELILRGLAAAAPHAPRSAQASNADSRPRRPSRTTNRS